MTDFLDQALGVLGAVAPTIATAFGGPLAGQAVRWVEGALGMPQMGDKNAVAAAIAAATPDQLIALKKADQDFQAHLAELGVELEKISAGDRDSARKMQTATGDWTPRALAVLLTLGYFAVLAYMLKFGVPATGGEALLVMLGALGAAFGAVVSFFFGSSAGSAKKDDTIKAALAR